MKSHNIVISRYWHRPKIDVFLLRNGIAIEFTVEDFVKAMARELGSPKLVLRQQTLENQMMDAAAMVIEKVKETSAAA